MVDFSKFDGVTDKKVKTPFGKVKLVALVGAGAAAVVVLAVLSGVFGG